MRNIIDRIYRNVRGVPDGLDPDVSTRDLAEFLGQKSTQRLRASMRGFPKSYMGTGVRLRSRAQLSLGPQTSIGSAVTIDALSRIGITIGARSTIDHGAVLRGSGVIRNLGVGVEVGERTSIGAFNVILGQGGVHIGDDCLLGPNVTVVSENHVFASLDRPIREQGEVRLATHIGNNVWIGAGSVILGGARIGNGAIIAAGSVVRGEIAENAIAGGVPAKFIKERVDQ